MYNLPASPALLALEASPAGTVFLAFLASPALWAAAVWSAAQEAVLPVRRASVLADGL